MAREIHVIRTHVETPPERVRPLGAGRGRHAGRVDLAPEFRRRLPPALPGRAWCGSDLRRGRQQGAVHREGLRPWLRRADRLLRAALRAARRARGEEPRTPGVGGGRALLHRRPDGRDRGEHFRELDRELDPAALGRNTSGCPRTRPTWASRRRPWTRWTSASIAIWAKPRDPSSRSTCRDSNRRCSTGPGVRSPV